MSRNFTAAAMNQNTFILHLGLLLLVLIFSTAANAADSAGRLLFVRGEVQITSVDAEPRAAARGALLQVGDTIRTGAKSNAQLRMSDGAMISLKAGSEFRIEAQDYNKKAPGEGSQVGELLRGGLRAITGAIGHEKPEAVKYRTPVATIGIRGTVFDTIVIPPEGLPELPGMAPGTYVMVLEGQVLLSTPTGELLLGPGEVGYVPFVDAPPELRPDLESIFVEFAAFEEQERPQTGGGNDTYTRTAINQQDSTRIYTLMADVSAGQILTDNTPTGTTGATVSPGPYGIAVAGNGIPPLQGDFFSGTVTVGGNGELTGASNGGDISSFTLVATAPNIANQGTYTAGDSVINWGTYAPGDVLALDNFGGQVTTAFNYLTATNVIVTTADLPTVGSFTYNYVGGAATYANSPTTTVVTSGSLTVDFGTAQMDISLTGGYGTYSASNQNISDFYGNGITLAGSNGTNDSSISGRFVGSNAEGAVAGYSLNVIDGFATGVAVFAR